MRLLDRFGALTGLAGVLLLVPAVTLTDPASALNPNPNASAQLVARALTENAASAQVGAWLSLAATFLLMVFVGRLCHALRVAAPESWLPQVAMVASCALVTTLLVSISFSFVAAQPGAYAADTQVAKMVLTWDWNSASLFAPCFAAIMVAAATIAFAYRAFPAWFAWTTTALLAVMIVVAALNAAGMAIGPGLLWFMLTSILLASRREEPAAAAKPGRTEVPRGTQGSPSPA